MKSGAPSPFGTPRSPTTPQVSGVVVPGGAGTEGTPIVPDRRWVGAPSGSLANPTLWLGAVVLLMLGIGFIGYLTGALSPIATVAVNATAAYLAFTVMHEGTHGTGHRSHLVNRMLGRIMAPPLLLSFAVFRAVHHEHHSHTNDAGRDPDFIVARAPRVLLPFWCLVVVFEYRLAFYRRRLWRSRGECAEAVAIDVAFLAVVAAAIAGGWLVPLLVLWVVPAAVAVLFLAFAFDFLPHYPYDTDARYFDTRAYPGRLLNAHLPRTELPPRASSLDDDPLVSVSGRVPRDQARARCPRRARRLACATARAGCAAVVPPSRGLIHARLVAWRNLLVEAGTYPTRAAICGAVAQLGERLNGIRSRGCDSYQKNHPTTDNYDSSPGALLARSGSCW